MSRRASLALLAALLVAGFGARAWLAAVDDGIYWPDEIHASLGPAHRLAFGYGLISWEYGVGARSWALPGLVASVFVAAAAVGLDDPAEYLGVMGLLMGLVGVASAWAGYFLARRLGASEWTAAVGAAVFAISGPAVYFGPRALSDTISILPIVLGLAFALPGEAARRDRIFGASLLGVALLLRLHTALFAPALVLAWLARRRWREAAEVAVTFGVWILILGTLDLFTWGEWFQSPRLYLAFTFDMGGGAATGDSGAGYYFEMLGRSMPFIAVVLVPLAIAGLIRSPALGFIVAAVLGAHMLTPNKAYRYLLVLLPLTGTLASLGLHWLATSRLSWARAASAALLAACLWSLATMTSLTFAEIGPWEKTRPTQSAFDDVGPVNRLLTIAGRQPDLCGLRVTTHHLVWTGGYSYLHREVPLYAPDGPPLESGFYNYAIVPASDTTGNPVAHDDGFVLRKVGESCRPDPGYSYYLPGYEDIRRRLGR